jgi:hypothetical protein
MPFILCRDQNGNEFEVSQITIDRFPGDYKPVGAPKKATPAKPAKKAARKRAPKTNVTASAAGVTSGDSTLEGES